ncbi:tautomerase family protein [Vibrio mediterranei]
MPFIRLTTWKSDNQEMKENLVRELTKTVHRVTGAPMPKITVVIEEIPNTQWAEGGVLGYEPDFLSRSMKIEGSE